MAGVATGPSGAPQGRRPTVAAVVLPVLVLALAAWAIVVARMDGMDAGPGTPLGELGWYLGVWVTMMAAMMLPAVAPVATLVARANARTPTGGLARTAVFLVAYLAVWAGVGLAAYGIDRAIGAFEDDVLAWDRAGPLVAGAAVAAAGLYQLSPLKHACLRHCRSPLHFLLAGWRPGVLGALRMGTVHAAYCVGCCVGLMVVLFAVGVMSVPWMVIVAVAVLAEKVLPYGERIATVVAIALIVLGAAIAFAPDAVPLLTEPEPMGGMA